MRIEGSGRGGGSSGEGEDTRIGGLGRGRGGSGLAKVFAGLDGRFLAGTLGSRGCKAFLFCSFNFALDFAIDSRHDAQVFSSLLVGLDGSRRKEERGRI